MHDNPLVSVRVTTYRRPKELKTTLDSVVRQTYSNLEIIVSNNDCTDAETNALCGEYAKMDGRIRYYAQPENLGAMGNFRFTVDVSSGEYCFGVCDDDWLDENLVEVLVNKIQSEPQCSGVFARQVYYSDEYRQLSEDEVHNGINPEFPFTDNDADRYSDRLFNVLKGNFPSHILARTETLKNDIFNSLERNTRYADDFVFFAAIAFLGPILMAPGTHYHKRQDIKTQTVEHYKRLFNLSDIEIHSPEKECHVTVVDSIINDLFFVHRIPRSERMELVVDLLNALAVEKIRRGMHKDVLYKKSSHISDRFSWGKFDRFFEEEIKIKDLFRMLWRHPLILFKRKCTFLLSKKIKSAISEK